MNQAHRSKAPGPDATGLSNSPALKRNLEAPELYEEILRRGEGRIAEGGALVVGPASTPAARPRTNSSCATPPPKQTVWWDNNKPMTPGAFRCAACRHDATCRGARTVRPGSVRRRRPRLPHQGARRHRICLAFAVHPQAADPPAARRARRLRSRDSPSSICPASRPTRPAMASAPDRDRLRLRQQDGPDRRHAPMPAR